MSGINLVLDTNAMIAVLNGHEIATELVNGNSLYTSFISELEIQSFQKLSANELASIEMFLGEFVIIDLNPDQKENNSIEK